MAIAFFATVASAQTTGTILGVVTDASTGKPVPDALVVATSPALQGEQTALTDDTGNFRITILPPGRYKLSVQREGYKPAERTDITLNIDKTIRANMAVVPEAVQLEEQVVNTGTPVINVGTAETGAVVSKEYMSSVPVGRNFESTAIVAPGAQADRFGVSFSGATSPENNYILDGMNVTDPAFGLLGSTLLTNFVEEVDVKTGSFMPEYGRATGGVINTVTKSGSNEFHGSVFGNMTPGALSPKAKAIFRSSEAVGSETLSSKGYATDFGFEVGGPIMKDRLWFWLGAAPQLGHTVTDRYIQALQEDPAHPGQAVTDPSTGLTTGVRLPGTDSLYNNNTSNIYLTGKLTYLLNENNNLSLSLYTNPADNKGIGLVNSAASVRPFEQTGNSTDVIGRYAGKVLEKHLIIEALGGWHHQSFADQPATVAGINQRDTAFVRWDLQHSLADFEDVPAACRDTATFRPCPVTRYATGGYGLVQTTGLDRFNGKLSGSGLFSWFGHHNVKAGIDMDRSNYAHTKAYSGERSVREINDRRLGPVYQDFRQLGVQDPNNAGQALITDEEHVSSVTNTRAVYLQDSWSIKDLITINGGLRWEGQSMYEAGSTGPANLAINDNWGPRVQAIYDFTGQGRSKISANWGRFYENIPLDLADRSFHADSTVVDVRSRCVSPSPSVGGTPGSCDVIPRGVLDPSTGQLVTYRFIAAQDAVPVAPDLKGQFVDQFGAGVEYELISDLSVGLTYEGRRLGRVIEDMSVDDGVHYFIANPSESKPWTDKNGNVLNPRLATTTDPVTLRQFTASEPPPERKYDAITLEMRKTFSRHWLAQASYTYSATRGNYDGLFNGLTGQLDPNILSEYDLVSLLPNRFGPTSTDIPHQVKLSGSYVFDLGPRFNVVTGAFFRAHSGTPVNYLGAHPDYGPGEAFILPRGDAGRTPFVSTLDLKGKLEYVVTPPYTVAFSVDVFNLLNSHQTISVDQNYTYDSVKPIVNGSCKDRNGSEPGKNAIADCPDLAYLKTLDGRPVTVNKNFGKPTAYQQPLSVRFGLTVTF